MNKEELIKEYDEKAKALRDEFISKLEDDKKKFELTYPKNNEILYCISNANTNAYDVYFDITDPGDIKVFEHGLYFKTREEAEQYLKECKLLFKLHQWAKEKNDEWVPGWDISKCNYYLLYDSEDKKLTTTYGSRYKEFSKLPCFKSVKLAQECIDLFGDEIKEVLV